LLLVLVRADVFAAKSRLADVSFYCDEHIDYDPSARDTWEYVDFDALCRNRRD
jgi:hypothetical protein